MNEPAEPAQSSAEGGALAIDWPTDGELRLRLSGRWLMRTKHPRIDEVERELDAKSAPANASRPTIVRFDSRELAAWDSALLVFLTRAIELFRARSIEVDMNGLPSGARRL